MPSSSASKEFQRVVREDRPLHQARFVLQRPEMYGLVMIRPHRLLGRDEGQEKVFHADKVGNLASPSHRPRADESFPNQEPDHRSRRIGLTGRWPAR